MNGIDYEKLGNRIRDKRISVKMTQDTLAESAGISNNHISSFENNHTSASLDVVVKIANALSVSLDYLITEKCEEETRDTTILVKRLVLCSDKQYDLVCDFVEMILPKDI